MSEETTTRAHRDEYPQGEAEEIGLQRKPALLVSCEVVTFLPIQLAEDHTAGRIFPAYLQEGLHLTRLSEEESSHPSPHVPPSPLRVPQMKT